MGDPINFIASFAKYLVLSLVICLVSACAKPTAPTALPIRATPSIAPVTSTVETTGDCYYVEASNALPESAAAVRLAVEGAGVALQEVTVQGQGENYVCPNANTSQFGVRASFVTVTFQLKVVNDTEQLGAAAGEILDALNGLTQEQLPNWSSGQVILIAAANGDQVKLEFPGSHGLSLREQGLTGAALWEGLGNLPCQTTTTYKKLDDLSEQIHSELNAAGLTNVSAYAEATVYECIDPATNAVENSTVG
jgi:hypothetical protein